MEQAYLGLFPPPFFWGGTHPHWSLSFYFLYYVYTVEENISIEYQSARESIYLLIFPIAHFLLQINQFCSLIECTFQFLEETC